MAKHCPDCGERLVIRKNRITGEPFYGCSDYPDCDYTEEIDEFEEGWDEREREIKFR